MTTFVLKLLALLTMVVDHVAVCGWEMGWPVIGEQPALYLWLRGIGRIAFPIYCFLLANGLRYTRSRQKYLIRLFLCGLLSQLPFAAALYAGEWAATGVSVLWRHGNVLFTLFLGGLLAHVLERCRTGVSPKNILCLGGCCLLLLCLGLGWMDMDYGIMGVLLILLLYEVREKKWQVPVLLFWCLAEYLPLQTPQFFLVLAAVAAVALYNGKQGPKFQLFFYLSYPLHLAVLAALCWL